MSLRLSHSMEIETCLDFVQATLQPLSICAVDAGKAVEGRRRMRGDSLTFVPPAAGGCGNGLAPAGTGAARPGKGVTS